MRNASVLCLFTVFMILGQAHAGEVSQGKNVSHDKIKVSKRKNIACFWDAVSASDAIGIVESKKMGKGLKIVETIPAGINTSTIKLPEWTLWQMRGEGKYLIPLTKQASGYEVPGKNYRIPKIAVGSQDQLNLLIRRYKALEAGQEKEFLKGVMLNKDFSSLRYSCLRRLLALGEFNKPFSQQNRNFWEKVYSDNQTTIPCKRALLQHMSMCNFTPGSAMYVEALKNSTTHSLSAMIYYQKDKKGFESLMLTWLKDPKLRKYAVMNSDKMAGNAEYVASAMEHFDPKDKEMQQYYIPVLCVTKDKAGVTYLKNFLSTDKDPRNFGLYRKLFLAISKYNPTGYTAELKSFLKNNRNNSFILNSSIYPTILACLCKGKDVDGYKMTLDYLNKLPAESKARNDVMKINMVLRTFHIYNPKINKLDKLKEDISIKTKAATELSKLKKTG